MSKFNLNFKSSCSQGSFFLKTGSCGIERGGFLRPSDEFDGFDGRRGNVRWPLTLLPPPPCTPQGSDARLNGDVDGLVERSHAVPKVFLTVRDVQWPSLIC